MMNRRACLLVAVLAGGAVTASCSSDRITAGGPRVLAQILDSAFRIDSAAGLLLDVKTIAEEEVAFLANEGLQPAVVKVNTDSGTLLMYMLAGAGVDITPQGTIGDSISAVYGWTPDYKTWVIFLSEEVTPNGPALGASAIAPRRGRSLGSLMTSMRALVHHGVRAEVDIDSLDGNWLGFVWDHGATTATDSASGVTSWSRKPGHCSWEGVTLGERLEPDSAITCVPAIFNVRLTLRNPGAIPSLTHVSIPAQPIPAVRLVGFQF